MSLMYRNLHIVFHNGIVMLSGDGNYHLWKKQMLCLMKAHDMCGLVDDTKSTMDTLLVEKYDSLLQGWIFGSVSEDILRIVVNEDSAQDVWKKLKSCFDSSKQDSAPTKVGKKLEIKAGTEYVVEKVQQHIMNGKWDTLCHFLTIYPNGMTVKINNDGNTVLHIAVGIGRNDAVKKILSLYQFDNDWTQIKNWDGSTVLHIAAIVGNTYAAELLVKKFEKLLHTLDNKGQTPLDKAYENMHLDTIAFLLEAIEKNKKSDEVDGSSQPPAAAAADHVAGTKSSLLPPVERGVDLLANAISAKQYDFASKLIIRNPEYAVYNDNVLMAIARTFPSGLNYGERFVYPRLDNASKMTINGSKWLFNKLLIIASTAKECIQKIFCRRNEFKEFVAHGVLLILCVPIAMIYCICASILFVVLMIYFPFSTLYYLSWMFVARAVPAIKNIEIKKNEYVEAKKILELVCEKIISGRPDSGHEIYTAPILEAACQDAYEVVDEILRRWPEAIRCEDKNGYDIIQLATIHRSERVYNLIYVMGERKSIYGTVVDFSKNNMLHLAARLAPSNKLKRRRGAALQLQRELQWRQEVQQVILPVNVTKENIFMETPDMIFTREHENLVKEGEQWMKTVAESSSITAALITTIVFAAAITVPGGNNEDGAPVFLKDSAFTVFAISDAISLFSSATSLLVFLSILTARFAEEDFMVSLPRRLLIGLCTLLLSTTAMMVAFSATLFLVFTRRKMWVIGPICGLALVPIGFFFVLQFPLILDLFRSTYISKFGKNNQKNSKLNPNLRFFFSK
ncbi:hypothetical protein QVD17_02199 [Tagetes erecta]|uniref:PGG domain-containing protein n=1 Tax=Tagetes erecta TaxID=13708 RepID=A0AAD8L8Y4_TARER|nr:hypothetical protein QVD17_02199 [Tagetes erecta]